MIHFAYPNVVPRESQFLGCGRYVAALLGEAPDASYSLVELQIPNIAEVHLAALQLAPESADSQKVIYERKDMTVSPYRGESRDFAYVLALISRSRPLTFSGAILRGDIWCTGGVDIKGENRPFLKAVDPTGFFCKLEVFLSEENEDHLFLVPAANVLPGHEVLFQQRQARVVSLSQFQRIVPRDIAKHKTIIKVQGDELELLVSLLFQPPIADIDTPAVSLSNPYRGLFAFREQDAEVFFGRDSYVRQLLEAIPQTPFIAVIGASGCGKSSVIYAGLLPQLQHQGNWRMADFRPGAEPFHALASALVPLLEPEASEVERLVEMKKMSRLVESGALTVPDVLEAITEKHPNALFLVFADQFEELYTLCQEEQKRRQFLNELLKLPGACGKTWHLVLTMRADFLGKACSYRPFADALQTASQLLGPMNRGELREVIQKPAKPCRVTIEEGLTDRILDAVGEESGNLPLLEFALTKLWEKQQHHTLTHSAYNEIGGVQQALALYAESVYGNLSAEEQTQAQRIFPQLIRPGEGTEDTRRVATYDDIGEAHWGLVTKLADARLVVTGRKAHIPGEEEDSSHESVETVEVVHEALIHGWQRLRNWMETSREFRTWQEHLRAAVHQWKDSHYDTGALLRGVPLTEAHTWLNKKLGSVSHEEQQFIAASLRAHRRLKQRTQLGIGIGFALTVLIAVVLGFLWNNAEMQRQAAEITTLNALTQTSQALFLSKEDELGALLAGIKAGKYSQRPDVPVELKNRIITNLHTVVYGIHEKNRLEGHTLPVKTVDFSPDSRLLASGSNDRTIKLWDVADGRERMILYGHIGVVRSVSFSPDGQLLASGSNDTTIRFWHVETGNKLMTLYGHFRAVQCVSFSPDGRLLASGSSDTTVKLWDVSDGRTVLTLGVPTSRILPPFLEKGLSLFSFRKQSPPSPPGHSGGVLCLSFSPGGALLASGDWDGTIKLWRVADGSEVMTLRGHPGSIWSVGFSPDGSILASGSDDATIKLWNISDGTEMTTLRGHSDAVRSLSFSPDGRFLLSGSDELDSTLKLWDLSDGREINTFKGHYNSVVSVKFSHDGTLFASGSDDHAIKLWTLSDRESLTTLYKAAATVTDVAFSPDGSWLVSGDADKVITIWDIQQQQQYAKLSGHTHGVTSVSVSPDRSLLASGSTDTTIKLWDLAATREMFTLSGHTKAVESVRFSPDGTRLASASADHTIKLWDVNERQEQATLRGHSHAVKSIDFHPNGTMLASGSEDGTVKLWDLGRHQEIMTLRGHFYPVPGVCFSPDGKLLASGSGDNTIKIWNVADGRHLTTLKGHSRTLLCLDFSPDGSLLVSGSADNTIKLWNVADGTEILTLQGHSGSVSSVSFSPDGALLASGGNDQHVKLWNFDLDELLIRGCQQIRGYLEHNPGIHPGDRSLCQDILPQAHE